MNGVPDRSQPRDGGRPRRRSSLVGELWYLLRTTKKWWLAPILVAIAVLGILVLLGGSPAGPFIYSLF